MAEFNENLAIFLTLEEEFREFLTAHRRRIEIAERRATRNQARAGKIGNGAPSRRRRTGPAPARRHATTGGGWRTAANRGTTTLTLSLLREGDEGGQRPRVARFAVTGMIVLRLGNA